MAIAKNKVPTIKIRSQFNKSKSPKPRVLF